MDRVKTWPNITYPSYRRQLPHTCNPPTALSTLHTMSSPLSDPAIVSIGYEQRSIEEFVQLLVDARVDIAVDVRLNAISRKRGFSKTALSHALASAGINYRHERTLGNPKDNRAPFRQGHPDARNRYLQHLSNGAAPVLNDVTDLARHNRVALLCFERDHSQCHRSCIAQQAQELDPALTVLTI